MSYSNALLACENIQGRLDEMWLDPQQWPSQDDKMPFAEYITSPANKTGVPERITPGRGKIRTITMKYQHRWSEDDVEEDQPNPNCDSQGNKRAEYYVDHTIDPDVNLQFGIEVGLTDYELVCEDNSVRLAREIAAVIDVLDRKVATQIATQSVALTGGWASTFATGTAVGEVNASDRLVIATRLASSTNPDARAAMLLRNALDDTGYPNDVLYAGGKLMREYMQYLQAGCCTTNGVDLAAIMAQYGIAYAYDKRLEAALGSTVSGAGDRFMVMAPKTLQLLTYSRAEGKMAFGQEWLSSSDYSYRVIASPRFGIPYDLTMKDACGTLAINLTFTGKMIGLPEDMYGTSDDLDGVTWASQVQITNP
jgi:hypothetical protein